MIDKRYQTIIKEIRDISSDIARLDGDLTKDRQNLANFEVQMATLSEQVNQLRIEMGKITGDVGDKVKDTLKPAVKAVDGLKDEIKKKKIIHMPTKGIFNWLKQKLGGDNEKKNS